MALVDGDTLTETMPQTLPGVEIIEDEETKSSRYPDEPGDHEKFSHYTKKKELEAAIFSGTKCKALCGKEWTPTRDPKRFPVCPDCKKVFDSLPK